MGEWFVMAARFESICYGCGGMIKKGDIIWYNPELKYTTHLMCKSKLGNEEL